MSISQSEERSNRMIQGFATFVMAASLLSALLVISSDCSAVFGLLLWAVVAATFVFGICLPLLGRLIRGTTGTIAGKRSLMALFAMSVPVVLFYLEHYSHVAGCVG
jgi:hypothetical protein